jgi:hypothetical protein
VDDEDQAAVEAYRFWIGATDPQRQSALRLAKAHRLLRQAEPMAMLGLFFSIGLAGANGASLPPVAVFLLGALAAIFGLVILYIRIFGRRK